MIVPRKAAAAAAKKSWRRLLFLAWETPFDLFGQQQLHDMEQQAEEQQQQQQHGSLPPDSTAAADIETGLNPAGTSPQQHSNNSVGAHWGSNLSDTQQPAKQSGKQRQRQQKPQRPDMLVLDLPWYYHWPKAVIWLLFEGCHIALAVGESMANSRRACWQAVLYASTGALLKQTALVCEKFTIVTYMPPLGFSEPFKL